MEMAVKQYTQVNLSKDSNSCMPSSSSGETSVCIVHHYIHVVVCKHCCAPYTVTGGSVTGQPVASQCYWQYDVIQTSCISHTHLVYTSNI